MIRKLERNAKAPITGPDPRLEHFIVKRHRGRWIALAKESDEWGGPPPRIGGLVERGDGRPGKVPYTNYRCPEEMRTIVEQYLAAYGWQECCPEEA